MILTDDKGNSVDYFERFPTDVKNIGLSLSGGTDSALILYLLTKILQERKQEAFVYPIHGYNIIMEKSLSYQAAENVIDIVKAKLNDKTIIKPLHVFAYTKNGTISKDEFHLANFQYIKKRYNIPFIIRGITQGMPGDDRPLATGDPTPERMAHLSKTTLIVPFGGVNKKFIAHQYKLFNLDELYKVTSSCIDDSIEPCRNCWWCKEKYWAFGSYDGGIQ